MSSNDQLTALDATFLELEQADDGALMHIGGTLVFEPLPGGGAPAIGDVRAQLDRRLDLLPRYRQKLSAPRTGGLSWPSWEPYRHFEPEAHVRHATLPSPGDEHEFLDWISDFYSHRLDRSRPLWEMAVLGGLAHERWAVAWKTHHCLVDGVGSIDIAHLLLDTDPTPPEQPAGHAAPGSASAEARHRWLPDSPALLGQTAGASIGAGRAARTR